LQLGAWVEFRLFLFSILVSPHHGKGWKKENCFCFVFPLACEEEDMARYASVPIHFVCTRVFFFREEEENRETFQMSWESGRSFVRFFSPTKIVRLPIYASDFRQVEHTPNCVGEEAK
jgi:hypothetical protein